MSVWRNTLVEIGLAADEERSAEQERPNIERLSDQAAERMGDLLGAIEVEGSKSIRPQVINTAAALVRLAQAMEG